MSSETLTVHERILVYLGPYGRHSEEYVGPNEVTQDGIASSLGISRAHASIELKRLISKGLVNERTQHIKGSNRSSRLTYYPSTMGLGRIEEIRRSIGTPIEQLIFRPASKTVKRRDTLQEIDRLRTRLDELEARVRAEEAAR